MTFYGPTPGEGSAGVHTVSSGETVSSIARRYDIVMRDIVIANDMSAPFRLVPGQRIRLPPPRQYKARPGDTVYSVSRLFGVSSTELSALNHLSPPYGLRSGQVLKLPSAASQSQTEDTVRMAALPQAAPVVAEPLASPSSVVRPGKKPVYRFAGKEYGRVEESEKPALNAPEEKPQIRQVSAAAKAKISAQTPKRASSRFLQPVNGRVVSSYGSKPGGLHNDGINIAAARGTAVQAAENGVVVYAGDELKGSGNLVLIRHEGRWMTAYAHMDSIKVKRGDVVKRGQAIGTVGSTGSVDSPQLHFEIRRGTEAINPERYIEG